MFEKEQLLRTLAEIGADPGLELFDELAAAYDEPHRHYHDRRHVGECLRHFERYRQQAQRPAEIELALWFHDAVYDTRRDDNEEASAAWAERLLSAGGVHDDVVARIVGMILATKTHTPDSPDAALVVDIDLGVLGTDPATFETYDRAIRREYQWVPESDYRSGRSRVLESFLARRQIFATESIRAELEAQARENLARKLDELRA